MDKRIVIAIDGPAASGKSTLARRIAARLGFTYIDTGAMYRAVALWATRVPAPLGDLHRLERLAAEADIRFEPGATKVFLNGEDVTEAIRAAEMSQAASIVSAVPGVRRALVEKQRRMGAVSSVVMEGRDIGTVVFPGAQVKVFLDAAPGVRAVRRVEEKGGEPGEVAREMQERDTRDRTRSDSPLAQAPDAVYLDTSDLTIEQVEEAVLKIVRDKTSQGKELSQ